MNIHNNNRRLIWRWDGGGSGHVYIHCCSTFAVMISLWVKWNVCVILIHQSNNNIHCQNWIFQEIYCFCLALDDMMIIITIVVRGVSFYFYSWLWSHFTYLYRVIFLCSYTSCILHHYYFDIYYVITITIIATYTYVCSCTHTFSFIHLLNYFFLGVFPQKYKFICIYNAHMHKHKTCVCVSALLYCVLKKISNQKVKWGYFGKK